MCGAWCSIDSHTDLLHLWLAGIGGIKVQDDSEQVLREIATLLANKNRPDDDAMSDREQA